MRHATIDAGRYSGNSTQRLPDDTRAMARLSTHVLDTAQGRPAAGVALRLQRLDAAGSPTLVGSHRTNEDGRTATPLLAGATIETGRYRLSFDIADYFRACGLKLADPPFLDVVHIDFGIADAGADYHVPLLVSPWSYSTYRGS